jgi:hypothetical protein
MLLYKHSARCPSAIQMFLDCNPRYWRFVPMTKDEAQSQNESYILPDSIPIDPTSHVVPNEYTRSDFEVGNCMNNLPLLPSENYTFSTRQCGKQFQAFKDKRDLLMPNFDLDLYNATIIAVCKCLTFKTLTRADFTLEKRTF